LTLLNKKGKLGIAELTGASRTRKLNAPKNVEKVIRVSENTDPFIFRGKINDKFCDFKLDRALM